MKPIGRLAVLALCAAATLGPAAREAAASRECNGLPVCLRVAGPWVALPAPTREARYPSVTYQLRCPFRGYIVAGIDAEVSDRSIDLAFLGTIGGPVTPGVATGPAALFLAQYTGVARRPTSFRPLIGCVPTSGGGARSATGAAALRPLPPGSPTIRRVRTLRVLAGTRASLRHGCRPSERLVSASHAVAFHSLQPPEPRVIRAVRVTRRVIGRTISVFVRAKPALGGVRAEVQIHAVCARGPG